jgi:TatD DNase family protein
MADATEPKSIKNALDRYFQRIEEMICNDQYSENPKIIAIGECGLDYFRLQKADKETQIEVFRRHFPLAKKYNLPLYMTTKGSFDDFYPICQEFAHLNIRGVVNYFVGTIE